MATAEKDTFASKIAKFEDSVIALRLAPHFRDWRGRSPDPEVVRSLVSVARKLGANPAHLLAVVQHESAFNPRAQYGDIAGRDPFDPRRAQGLLQFTPSTAKGLGTSAQAIRAMSAAQQAKLVEKYLGQRARERLDGGPLNTLSKVALATFYPAYMNRSPDTLFPARVEEANPGIRTPADYLALVVADLPLPELEAIGEGQTARIGDVEDGPEPPPTGTLDEILSLLQAKINYTAQQKGKVETQANALRVILREFNAAGVPLPITLAAMANAFAESKLDPNAIAAYPIWTFSSASGAAAAAPRAFTPGGVPEDSRGLFMLNARGAGRGISALERHDPTLNTRRILEEYQGPWGDGGKGLSKDRGDGGLRAAYANGAPVQTLAFLWARDIERPAVVDAKRIAVQNEFLGPFAPLANLGQQVRRTGRDLARKAASSAGAGVLGVLLLFGAGLFAIARRARR